MIDLLAKADDKITFCEKVCDSGIFCLADEIELLFAAKCYNKLLALEDKYYQSEYFTFNYNLQKHLQATNVESTKLFVSCCTIALQITT